MKKSFLVLLFSAIFLVPVSSAIACHIQVDFDPNPVNVTVGSSFSIDLFADIPDEKSIVGWGLGLSITNGDLLFLEEITIGESWIATSASPSEFGGVVGTNPPIFGNDVLLATLDFTCLDLGTSYLDLFGAGQMMGFREVGNVIEIPGREPIAMPGDVVRFNYNRGVINQVVPEPATLLLLGGGLIGIAGLRRKIKRI